MTQREATRLAEVKKFLGDHPEFDDARFTQKHRERRWLDGKNLDTLAMDPTELGSAGFPNVFSNPEQGAADSETVSDTVDRALSRMRPRDVSLLQRRFLELMTLDAIAAEEGVTRQAIIKRLKTAQDRFRREMVLG
jgi:DNA-directed RNA polymerase specialized sigma24 family protein